MSKSSARAGWYPDIKAAGGERFWDGERWTNDRRAIPTPLEVPPHTTSPSGWSIRRYGIASIVAYVMSGSVYSWTALSAETRVRIGVLLIALATGFALVAIIATGVRLGLREHAGEDHAVDR